MVLDDAIARGSTTVELLDRLSAEGVAPVRVACTREQGRRQIRGGQMRGGQIWGVSARSAADARTARVRSARAAPCAAVSAADSSVRVPRSTKAPWSR